MSSEKKVRVTVEACGEVRSFECRCATLSTSNGDGTGHSCFVGSGGLARKLMLIAVLGADPRGHADSVQTLDLDARREIRDMAAELGVDADF